MPRSAGSRVFPWFVIAAALFVWLSSLFLPAGVASHFDASGHANGFMPRSAYCAFMAALIVLLPLLIVYLPNRLMTRASGLINLPHREYWLAAERRDATIAYLCDHSCRFGYLVVGFLAYVHGLVVMANASLPPHLNSAWFIGGLVVAAAGAVALLVALVRRFARVPRQAQAAVGTPVRSWNKE